MLEILAINILQLNSNPSTGMNNDIFYVVIKGPCKVLGDSSQRNQVTYLFFPGRFTDNKRPAVWWSYLSVRLINLSAKPFSLMQWQSYSSQVSKRFWLGEADNMDGSALSFSDKIPGQELFTVLAELLCFTVLGTVISDFILLCDFGLLKKVFFPSCCSTETLDHLLQIRINFLSKNYISVFYGKEILRAISQFYFDLRTMNYWKLI